jgi:hypothetical protein
MYSLCSGSQQGPVGLDVQGGLLATINRANYAYVADTYSGAFHVFTSSSVLVNLFLWIDGTSITTGGGAAANTGDFDSMGKYNGSTYSDGDIAEIIIYNVSLALLRATDRANIEAYLGNKYGITVAGGSAVDPSTVAGLVGWWKADSGLS